MLDTIEFEINETDLLQHKLYIATQSETVMKGFHRGGKRLFVVFIVLALIFFLLDGAIWLPVFYIIIGLGFYFFYPKYLKKRYHKHCAKLVNEFFAKHTGPEAIISFDAEKIYQKNKVSESSILLSHVEKVTEIPSHYFIRLSTGESIVVPKNRNLAQGEAIKFTKLLAATADVPIVNETDWEWE